MISPCSFSPVQLTEAQAKRAQRIVTGISMEGRHPGVDHATFVLREVNRR